MIRFSKSSRRAFLVGATGSAVALPFLESIAPKRSRADSGAQPFFIHYLQVYGVQQRMRFGGPHAAETERFWPDVDMSSGRAALTDNALPTLERSERATHELRGVESHLNILRGVRFHETTQNHHESRRAQLLTGSAQAYTRPDPVAEEFRNAWGRHESFDWRVAREFSGRPMHCVKNADVYQVSFDRTLGGARGETNPLTVYRQLFMAGTPSGHEETRRRLATDYLAAEMSSLRADTRLSRTDQLKLERHADLLRAAETRLSCMTPEMSSPLLRNTVACQASVGIIQDDGSITGMQPAYESRYYPEETALSYLELVALGAACGAITSAIVSVEGFLYANTDIFPEGPQRTAGFPTWHHAISHRVLSRDPSADWRGEGEYEHHRVDRWHMRKFRFLVDRLIELEALDHGVTMYANEIATGAHEAADVPIIVAGNCNGRLRTGQAIDFHGSGSPDMNRCMPNNRLLNTLGAAMGLRSEDGMPLHDFGGIRPDGSRDEGGFADALVGF